MKTVVLLLVLFRPPLLSLCHRPTTDHIQRLSERYGNDGPVKRAVQMQQLLSRGYDAAKPVLQSAKKVHARIVH